MKNRKSYAILTLLCLLFALAVQPAAAYPVQSPSLSSAPPPGLITYQGHLMEAGGTPVLDDTYQMTFSLWDAATEGNQLWGPETHAVSTTDGFFAVTLGNEFPIDADALDTETYIEIVIEEETLSPRQRLASVAFALSAQAAQEAQYAVEAGDASTLGGNDVDYFQRRVLDVCPLGSSIREIRADGTVVCQDAETAVTATYAISSTHAVSATYTYSADHAASADYADDAGLLGGQTAAYYLNWDNLTNLPPGFADGVDNDTTYTAGDGLSLNGDEFSADTDYLQRRVLDVCPLGSSIREIRSDGTVVCQDVETAVTATYAISSSHAVTATYTYSADHAASADYADDAGLLGGQTAAYYLNWDNLINLPPGFADGVDDDTTYTAGDGLDLVGDEFSADTDYLQRRVLDVCPLGSSIREIRSDGTVVCQDVETAMTATYAISSTHAVTATYTSYADHAASADYADNAGLLGGQTAAYYLNWDNLTNLPPGFADGVDDDTTYTAGDGLDLVGEEFSADTDYLQRRVLDVCPLGSSIREIRSDGTVVCQDVETAMTATYAISSTHAVTATYTSHADHAASADYADDAGLLGGQTAAYYLNWDNLTNLPPGFADGVDNDTTYTAGDGLSLNGDEFSVSDAYRLPQACNHGQIAMWDESTFSHSWMCTDDDSGVAYTAGDGLNLVGDEFSIETSYSLPQTCSDGQVAEWNGDTWTCGKSGHTDVKIHDVGGTAARDEFTSITVGSDGLPLIVKSDPRGLYAIHCANDACQSPTINMVDSGRTYQVNVIIGSDALPVIVYQSGMGGPLKVAHCDDVLCSSSTNTVLYSDQKMFGTPFITIGPDGYPLISCNGSTYTSDRMVRLTHCEDHACNNFTVQDVFNPRGTSIDNKPAPIAVGLDGLPVIASYNGKSLERPKFIHCDTITCSTYTMNEIPVSRYVDTYDVAIGIDGMPLLVVDNSVIHCHDSACNNSTVSTLYQSVTHFASIAIGPDGMPVIAFFTGSSPYDLAVARCDDLACTSSVVNIVAQNVSGRSKAFNAITIAADGFPIISYYKSTGDTHIAHCANDFCWQRSQPGPMINGVLYPPYFTRR